VHAPSRIVVAVPVAPIETAEALRSEVDELICPLIPEWLMSIGYFYMDFSQTSDKEVMDLLQRAWQRELEQ
jgi:putative phosphoribosyl transferase